MSAFKSLTSDNVTVANTLTFPNRITINNMPTGAANQTLQTNGSGDPVYGNNTPTPGTNEQSMWTVGGVSTWQSRSFRYGVSYGSFTSSDWNLAATNTLAIDSTFNSSSLSFGTTGFSNITRVSASALACNTTGLYKITMMAQITNGGLLISRIAFNVLINGVVQSPGSQIELDAGRTGMLTSTVILPITAGNSISFRSTRISGTSAMNCVSINSNLLLECLSTLV